MAVDVSSEEVRALVSQVFQRHGVIVRRGPDIIESALFDDGRCVAWSYRLTGWMAMWFVDIGLLQFYDPDGNMLQTLTLHEPPREHRMAA